MKNSSVYSILLIVILSFSGCCSKVSGPVTDSITAISSKSFDNSTPEIPLQHIPQFYIKNSSASFNTIGTPTALATKSNKPSIVVDGDTSTIYFEEDSFKTENGNYINYIYRVHFEKVPLGLNCFNLTAGSNPGLLIIYTLDEQKRVVLITTVHSCGCYLAFIPTSALPIHAFPDDWPQNHQQIHGFSLPHMLPAATDANDGHYQFTLESETHRISDVAVVTDGMTLEDDHIPLQLRPMVDLFQLPYNGSTVSFFKSRGSRAGYVKNNTKILEKLFISWWAFDWHVGEDKAYGKNDTSTIPFYTSLKFWNREASNMKNFPAFLRFWGWKL